MKKTMILFAMAVLFLSCKKEKDEVVPVRILDDVTVYVLLGYNPNSVVSPSDSALVELYSHSTGDKISSQYTDLEGKVILPPVKQNEKYYFTFKTRSYFIGNTTSVNYYEGGWNLYLIHYDLASAPKYYFKNYYVCIGEGVGERPGYGSTAVPVVNPWH